MLGERLCSYGVAATTAALQGVGAATGRLATLSNLRTGCKTDAYAAAPGSGACFLLVSFSR